MLSVTLSSLHSTSIESTDDRGHESDDTQNDDFRSVQQQLSDLTLKYEALESKYINIRNEKEEYKKEVLYNIYSNFKNVYFCIFVCMYNIYILYCTN